MKVGGGASSEPLGTSTAREGGGMASGALNEPLCSPTVREGMEAAVLVALELSWRLHHAVLIAFVGVTSSLSSSLVGRWVHPWRGNMWEWWAVERLGLTAGEAA